MTPEAQGILLTGAIALVGWVVKEVASIRPLKENVDALRDAVDHTRRRVDDIYDHLLDHE